MFNDIKKSLYLSRMRLLIKNGFVSKKIIPFDDEFYEKLKHTYINALPVYFHIKYLKPLCPPGKCYERSSYMFFCFDDAILVRGDNKDLELRYGKEDAGHGWIERDNYVYDPSLMMRFEKDLYYKIYEPTNIFKYTKEEYCSKSGCQEFYDDIKNTTIDDFKPHGNKRIELSMVIPLIMGIAKNSNNQEFIDELNEFLTLIKYDEEELFTELDEEFEKIYHK